MQPHMHTLPTLILAVTMALIFGCQTGAGRKKPPASPSPSPTPSPTPSQSPSPTPSPTLSPTQSDLERDCWHYGVLVESFATSRDRGLPIQYTYDLIRKQRLEPEQLTQLENMVTIVYHKSDISPAQFKQLTEQHCLRLISPRD